MSPFFWYLYQPADIMVKMVISGSLPSDPSYSHGEEKGRFIDCFMPFHFNVLNSKSEIPFLLKASAGPRTRCICPSKERLSHGSLSRNIP